MATRSATSSRVSHMQPLSPPKVALATAAFHAITTQTLATDGGVEVGGILLGIDTTNTVTVRHAGTPGPAAIREERFFLRDLEHSRRLAREAWEEDSSQWVGEWHTHPSGALVPSPTDLRSYLAHLHDEELGFRRFISIIAAARGDSVLARAWVIDKAHAVEVPLVRI